MKFETENNKHFLYALIILVFLGGTINLIIGFSNFLKYCRTIENGVNVEAVVIKEIKNNFGEYPSFKYEIEYIYDNEKYIQINDGIFKTGHYIIGQKIQLIVDSKNPLRFIDVSTVNYQNNFIISIICFVFFGLIFYFKNKILFLMDKIS